MRYVIIEDEPLAAEKIAADILRLRPQWNLLKIIPSVKMATLELNDLNPELIFLDVHLGDGNSFQIFQKLEINVPVIFTTAFDQYALKAFEINSVDYLLKPVSKSDLEMALLKLERHFGKQEKFQANWDKLLQDLRPSYKERFMVSTGKRIKSLNTDQIAFFFAQGKHVFITDKEGKEYLTDKTLTSLSSSLNPKEFFHINRQYIVAISCINEMLLYSKGRLKLITQPNTPSEAIVSGEKAARFKLWLEGE